jgi:hypothetical protein
MTRLKSALASPSSRSSLLIITFVSEIWTTKNAEIETFEDIKIQIQTHRGVSFIDNAQQLRTQMQERKGKKKW